MLDWRERRLNIFDLRELKCDVVVWGLRGYFRSPKEGKVPLSLSSSPGCHSIIHANRRKDSLDEKK